MPIFEYVCEECNHLFETLVTREDNVSCPSCKGDHLTKQYSRFGLGKASAGGPYESLPLYKGGGGCGCTPSTCGCKN